MSFTRSIVAVILFVLVSQPVDAEVHRRHVRPVDALAKVIFDLGRARSDFFRALADAIEDSDVIVYVQTAQTLPRGMDGKLQFAAAVEGARYLRITVRCDLARERLVALLGHELMHAVEIARDLSVRDSASLRALYLRIGDSEDGATFDTRAAVAAGVHVLGELKNEERRTKN